MQEHYKEVLEIESIFEIEQETEGTEG